MIPCKNFEVKILSALLRGKISKNYANFSCLNCRHSFRTTSKLELHEKVCENKDFCNVIMLSEDTEILEIIKNLINLQSLFLQILNV